MSFEHYVDDLAKRGIIDGHIAEMLVGKHRDEVGNPLKPVMDALKPILEDMWKEPGEEYHQYADRIDDAVDALANGWRSAQ